MTKTLILFEGLYGAGKSTTSQYVAKQLSLNGLSTRWLDEYQLLTRFFVPFFEGFRQGEKGIGDLLVSGWKNLSDSLLETEETLAVLDGPFMTNNIVRMLAVNHSPDEIATYTAQVIKLLAPYRLQFVYLTSDVRQSLKQTCEIRGDAWTDFIISETAQYAYQQARNRKGFSGLLEFFADAGTLFENVANELGIKRLIVDRTDKNWDAVQQRILAYFGVDSVPIALPQVSIDQLKQYEGIYDPPEDMPGQGLFIVEQVGDDLSFKTPFSNDYKLIPETETKFNIAGTRLFVAFLPTPNGSVNALDYTFWDGETYRCQRTRHDKG